MKLLILPALAFAFFIGIWVVEANAQISNDAANTNSFSALIQEPVTILVLGIGLASVGMAARRRFGIKASETDEIE